MLTVARWTQPDYVERARSSGRAQLLTIPYSHYVELARWTLEVLSHIVEWIHGYMTSTRLTLTQLLRNYTHTHT